jgi:hypothetical protein
LTEFYKCCIIYNVKRKGQRLGRLPIVKKGLCKLLNVFIRNLNAKTEKEFNLPMDSEELENTLQEFLGGKGFQSEYIISSYEFDVDYNELNGEVSISEHDDVLSLNQACNIIEDELFVNFASETDIIIALAEAYSSDFLEIAKEIDGGEGYKFYFYPGETLEDRAYDIIENCYDLPEIAQRYFDYGAFARDLSYDNFSETSKGVLEFI